MSRSLATAVALVVLLPSAAAAKTGVEFQTAPEQSKVGHTIPFTVTVWREPPSPSGRAHPVVGIHPLVTFRSDSGRVIRVRASRTNRFGLAHGKVAFTDKGPWTTVFHVKTHGVYVGNDASGPISVGTGLVQVIPPADATRPQAHGSAAEFPWVWVLSLASIGAALLVLVMRRRGRWGAA